MMHVVPTEEIGAALAEFFREWRGPSHAELSEVFGRNGAAHLDPLRVDSRVGKMRRVSAVVCDAAAHPEVVGPSLIENLIARIRVKGGFNPATSDYAGEAAVAAAQRAFHRSGWLLDDAGAIAPLVLRDVTGVERRPAIEAQIRRIKNATEDPALLVGTSKELLESAAKYVLDEVGWPVKHNLGFEELLFHARERLELLPTSVDASDASGKVLREMLDGLWKVAKAVNELRDKEGTGHGRTILPSTSPEMATGAVQAAALLLRSCFSRSTGSITDVLRAKSAA